jgi:hypothetical protein
MPAARHKLVLIEWVDSHSVEGWHRSDPETEPLTIRSVGWLVHDGPAARTIAASISEEESPQRCMEITIPCSAIQSVRAIRENPMPKGTKVSKCVAKVKRKGAGNPYAICQKATGQSYATGKRRTKAGKPVGGKRKGKK